MYLKISINDGTELNINFSNKELYVLCPNCGCEYKLDMPSFIRVITSTLTQSELNELKDFVNVEKVSRLPSFQCPFCLHSWIENPFSSHSPTKEMNHQCDPKPFKLPF
jgi:predicted RNA-binding Zn-ribbon protein involved in translation (DUF1610 family)